MKTTRQLQFMDDASARATMTPNSGADFQVSGLEDVVYAMDLNKMHREQLLRLAMIGRYMTTSAEDLLFERDGGLKL